MTGVAANPANATAARSQAAITQAGKPAAHDGRAFGGKRRRAALLILMAALLAAWFGAGLAPGVATAQTVDNKGKAVTDARPSAAQPPATPAAKPQPAAAGEDPAAARTETADQAARIAAETRAKILETAHAVFDREKVRLAETETALARGNHTSSQLDELRAQATATTAALQEAMPPLTQRAASAKALLDQLGPKPDEKKDGPETPEAIAEREDRQKHFTEYSDAIRIGNALLLQASQITESVSAARRTRFTHALLDHSWSIFSPELWSFVADAAPANILAMAKIGSDWVAAVRERFADGRMLPFGVSLAALALVWLGRRLVLHRIHARTLSRETPGRLRRAVTGLLVAASDTAAVALACWLLYLGMDGSNLATAGVDPTIRTVLFTIILLTFIRGMIKTLLSPATARWRVLDLPDQTAGPAAASLMTAATIALIGKALGDVLEAIGGDRATTAALHAIVAASVALVLAHMLRTMRDNVECDEQSLGPYVPTSGAAVGLWRPGGWAVVAITLAAVTAGFIPLATFTIDQTLWALMLYGMARLLLVIIDDGVGSAFADSSRISVAMQTSVGVRKRSLQQLGVVLAGLLRISLIALAVLLLLAPLGVDSNDFVGSIRNAVFGLHVAGFNISLASLFWGVGLLVVGVILTRAFQSWLQQKFLPATSLDSGLRNSITTAAGYLGVFIAVAATLASFGLSLDKIAIVAGALSVGIGFGLQSIVNNFVSGLILLWDRSISVGDWIVVGTEQGYVKRISVRATEIQTFERASIIVPNSTIVSGTVKNWLRNNRTGRISIVVATGYQEDPQTVSDLLLRCANAHPDVLREPKASVLFNSFTATTQEFELRCFSDVEAMGRIRSDLNYRIFRALSEAEIYSAPKAGVSDVRVLLPDEVQRLLEQRLGDDGERVVRAAATPRARRRRRVGEDASGKQANDSTD